MITEFIRYLAAKRSVDDRALNRLVWETLKQALPAGRPLDVLEVGAGIGTMVERCLEWNLFTAAHYTAVDAEAGNLAAARQRLQDWARAQHWSTAAPGSGALTLAQAPRQLDLELITADALAFARQPAHRRAYDLLIAHAFLDLVDIATALPDLLALLRPGGLFYFTITFDGVTSFQPEFLPGYDAALEALYHDTMDRREVDGKPAGDHQAGRHLLSQVLAAGADVLAAGPSDWVVFPQRGRYVGDEAYFLHFIVDTVAGALAGNQRLNAGQLAAWKTARHAQIDRGELTYIAHQLDITGRVD